MVYFEDDGEALCAHQPVSLGTHVLVEIDEVEVPLSVQSREEQEDFCVLEVYDRETGGLLDEVSGVEHLEYSGEV